MDIDKPSYYAIITAPVRYDQSLPPNAKLLYGEITALTHKDGYCWASNSYFSKLYNVHEKTISLWINKLKSSGHINCVIETGYQRKIYLPGFGGIIQFLLLRKATCL